jgi:hypothetical protein
LILPLQTGLASARRWLPEGLARSREIAAIEGLAQRLPDVMSAIGFEVRLGEADPRIDFGTVIYAEDTGRSALGASIDATSSANQVPRWPSSWDPLEGFFRRWCDPASAVHDGVARLFFEFDMSSEAPTRSIPCLFVTLDETMWSRVRDPLSVLPIVHETLGLIAGERRAQGESGLIRSCMENLPPGSMLLHIGAMLSRPECPIRFCGWMPSELLPHYLEAIRAPVDTQSVRAFCDLQSSAITFQLTFVRGELAPRLDIEWHFRRQPRAEVRWAALLRAMVEKGLCSREKCEAVLDWPGLAPETTGSATGHLVARGVSHIKVSLGGAAGSSAKAYLTLAPARSLRTLTRSSVNPEVAGR